MTLRGFSSRDHPKAASAHPSELSSSRSTAPITSSLRPSPLAPRTTLAHQDSEGSGSAQTPQRRRSSVTEHIVSPSVRTSTYRSSATATANAGSHGKIYSSSPLTRSFNWQPGSSTANRQGDDTPSHPPISNNNNNNQGPEGTESTTSNTAPSTVWDELDDLKSRIHRLELTGKLPPTSGAAVSRLTEDRPPTATTTATTASSSPKRSREVASQSNGNGANTTTETTGTVVPSQKEAYPVLVSALSKSKPFLNQDIFRALESAATDAMALAGMMGQPGEPGPISGAASAVGGPSPAVTDRQLRRKADSVCRSLTELCVALGEDSAHSSRAYGVVQQQPQQQQPPKTSASSNNDSTAPAPPQLQQPQPPQQQQAPQTSERQYHPSTSSVSQADGPSTPTIHKSFNGLHSRRASITSLALPAKSQLASPTRGPSKFEERRNTILNLGSALPSPRNPVAASTPATPQEPTAARRSSLLVARTRRAVTEEPEDPAATGRKSSLLRTRRAGTEEPEDREQQQPGGGRQTALLRRGRRGTAGEEDESVAAAAAAAVSNFRAPSRAFTEVASSRGPPREYTEVASSTRGPTREYATRDYSHFQNQPLSPTTPLPSTEMPDTNTSQASLALPRRRFVSSSASNMRAAAAGAGTPAGAGAGQGSALPTRKNYGPPPTSMTNLPEAGGRYASLGQTVFPGRTLSTRRYRDGVPRAS